MCKLQRSRPRENPCLGISSQVLFVVLKSSPHARPQTAEKLKILRELRPFAVSIVPIIGPHCCAWRENFP